MVVDGALRQDERIMRQKLLPTLFSLFLGVALFGQGVGINNPTPDASALLDLTSTGKGLLLPRMTTVQRDAIPLPATSLLIYNSTSASFEYFDGVAWAAIASPGWSLTGNTGTNPTTNFIGTTNAQPLAFRTNGIERMRIGAGATTQVGINTTTPGSTLHVLFTLPNNINSAVQVETNQGTSNTNIGFRNSITNSFASLGMQSNGDFGLGLSCNFGGCGFGTEAFRVKANGNFGIGTSNAAERLHVVGNIRMVDGNQATGRVMVSNAFGTASWQAPNASLFGGWGTTGNAGTDPTNFLGTTDAVDLNIRTANTQRLSIAANGKVFLGTSVPTTDSWAGFSKAVLGTNDTDNDLTLRSSGTDIPIFNVLRSSGTMAAPTVLPNGAEVGGVRFWKYTGTGIFDGYVPAGRVTSIATTTGALLQLGIGTTAAMTVTSANTVGIGTSAPSEELEVVGSVLTSGDGEGVIVDAGGSKRVGLMKYAGSEGALVHGNTVPLRFGQVDQTDVTGGTFTEQVRIDNNGNVGIGLPAPATKLHVNGAIATLPIVLSATTSPFVFPPGDRTYIRFASTSTPVNRTVIFANGLTPGQLLIVECIAPGGFNGIRFSDQVNMNVSGIRDLTIDDTITFIWNGTKWVEIAFSDN